MNIINIITIKLQVSSILINSSWNSIYSVFLFLFSVIER